MARKWSVVISAPKGDNGANWGDTWFAADLVDALRRAGEDAKTVFRGGAESEKRERDDVVVVLRGLRRVVPRRGNAVWLLWVISHPELVEPDEPAEYDGVFAASMSWSRATTFGVAVTPLLQATNAHRFNPEAAPPDTGEDILFVGSARGGEFRPVVRAALEAGIDVGIYGASWTQFVEPSRIRADSLPNDRLPAAYASAGVVLNDHWPEMAAEGFVSNRLFDAAACGSRILSDQAVGLREVFGTTVRTYGRPDDVGPYLSADRDAVFPGRAERLQLAQRVAAWHSFDARAAVLIEAAERVRGRR